MAKNPKRVKGAKLTTAKKSCCRDEPRCAKCPVVLMRLAAMGYAERDTEMPRRFTVEKGIPKKAMLIARQR